jgi:8-oxo-dGTP pyrophosphatase MutT (NUDIX family)
LRAWFQKSVSQVGALPFVDVGDDLLIALITSRRRGRWIIPKGWPVKGLTFSESAAREALEEAGCLGPIAASPCGSYDYQKRAGSGYSVTATVQVFPLNVVCQKLGWRERCQRSLKWMPLNEAVACVDDEGLSRLIAKIAQMPKSLNPENFIRTDSWSDHQ